MDNHFHLICQGDDLGKIIKEIKSHTAREIIKLAEQNHKTWLLNQLSFYKLKHKVDSIHQVWQEGNHPKQIRSGEMLRQKLDYLHHNPVRAGLADKPGGLAIFQRPKLGRAARDVGDRSFGDLETAPSRACRTGRSQAGAWEREKTFSTIMVNNALGRGYAAPQLAAGH